MNNSLFFDATLNIVSNDIQLASQRHSMLITTAKQIVPRAAVNFMVENDFETRNLWVSRHISYRTVFV
jgi:precorrin-6B methylase 1